MCFDVLYHFLARDPADPKGHRNGPIAGKDSGVDFRPSRPRTPSGRAWAKAVEDGAIYYAAFLDPD